MQTCKGLFGEMLAGEDIFKKKTLCWWSAESVLSLFAVMLKQVRQLENSTYISVKTAQELVLRNWTQSSYFGLMSSEDSLSAGKRRCCFKGKLILHQAQHDSSHKSGGKKRMRLQATWSCVCVCVGGRRQYGGGYHHCGDVKSGCFSEHQERRALAVH